MGGSDGSTCTGRGEVVGGTGEDLDAGTIHSDHAPARGEAGLTRVAGASEIADELSAATTTGTFWRGATVLAMGVFFVVELAVLVLACLPGLILGLIGFLGGDAEHSAAMKASSDGYEIEISGAIGLDLAQEFEQFLNKWPDAKTVHVNLNEGGSMTGAVKLRNLIHKRGLNTYVSSQCVSACALVFMGGRERLLRRYALIGFHRFSLYTIDIDIVEGVNTSKLKAEFRKLYLETGVAEEFVEKILAIPANRIWYPKPKELLEAGVISRVTDGHEFTLAETETDDDIRQLKNIDREIAYLMDEKNADADGFEERQKKYNARIVTENEILEQMAKSPESKRFMSLAREHNELTPEINSLRAQIAKSLPEMSKLSKNYTKQDILQGGDDVFYSMHKNFCSLFLDYVEVHRRAADILAARAELVKNPVVFDELFSDQFASGDFRAHQIFVSIKNNKIDYLNRRIYVYNSWHCDIYQKAQK